MSPRIFFALFLSAVIAVMVSADDCSCPGGVNVCKCRPAVVRPQRQRRPCLNTCSRCDYAPYSFTDPCIRRRTSVSPAQRQSSRLAALPTNENPPQCNVQPSYTVPFSQDDCECGSPFYHQNGCHIDNQEYLKSPVDPVSLYLASKNTQKALNVDEAKISYGFYKEPNQLKVEQAANVKEAALNTIARKVLVLKEEPKKSKFSLEPISCEDDDERESPKARAPTYNELGYTTFNHLPCPCPSAAGHNFDQRSSRAQSPQCSDFNLRSSIAQSSAPQRSFQLFQSRDSQRQTGRSSTSERSFFNF